MIAIKNKLKILKICLIVLLTSFAIGIIIAIMSAYNFFDYSKEVSIIEINDKTIKVQSGEENGDPIIYELKRNKILNYKINDKIYIKLNDNKVKYSIIQIEPKKIEKIGVILILAPFFIIALIILFMIFVVLPIYLIKKCNNRIALSIIYIMFCIGMIVGVIFENNIWDIIGLLLMIIPGIIYCIIKTKKIAQSNKNNYKGK